MLLLLPGITFARQRTDTVNLQPYHFYSITKGRIKQEVTRNTARYNRFGQDTASINEYDPQGRITRYVNFSDQKPEEHTYTYVHQPGSRLYTREDHATRNGTTITLDTIRNARGQDSVTTYRSPMGKDTLVAQTTYAHDGAGWLTKKSYSVGKRIQIIDEYFYDHGRLSRTIHTSNPEFNKNHYNETIYTYTPDSLIAALEIYEHFNNRHNLISYNYYAYNGRQLTTEKYCDMGKPLDTIKTHYQYDSQGRLSQMQTQKDTLYSNLTYTYINGHLSHIHAERNLLIGLFRGFGTFPNWPSVPHFPLIYDKNLKYDGRGNLIWLNEQVAGQPPRMIIYSYQYY